MAMTAIELTAKNQIIRVLNKQGYPTYARLLDLFDVNLTTDPKVVGYMEPGRARIVLNRGLNMDQVSTIVRHEILHEYLTHGPRGEAFEKKKFRDLFGKEGRIGNPELSNMAADWEISNKGYTDADKITVRNIMLNDDILKGLVTELDRPGWETLTYEEMYDKLIDEHKDDLNNIQQALQNMPGFGKPRIGDKGDPSIQDAEELERQANAVSNDAGEMIDQAEKEAEEAKQAGDKAGEKEAEEKKKQAEKAKEAADKAAEAAKDLKDKESSQSNDGEIGNENGGQVFKDQKEVDKERKIRERKEKIDKIIHDASKLIDLEREVERNIDKEKLAKAAKDAERYRKDPINNFRISLDNFIKKEIAYNRGGTWKKFNKNAISTGIIKRGISSRSTSKIPVINVYFDRSGSFAGRPEKTASAERAIATLNQYVRQGKLKINLYYASTHVYDDRATAERQGGGMDSDPVIEHIRGTKPDNVIIITDSDANYGSDSATVPGAVWYLFYESDAPDMVARLKGEKLTKVYSI